MTYELNLDQLNQKISSAFEATADAYADAQIEAMEAVIYEWDGTITHRKSGEVVDSPRNIIDTGELRDSLSQENETLKRTYNYTADHAGEVHEGYTTLSGIEKPARPWTERAREEFIDLEQTMGEELRKQINS